MLLAARALLTLGSLCNYLLPSNPGVPPGGIIGLVHGNVGIHILHDKILVNLEQLFAIHAVAFVELIF